jgi:predicted alpha/beta-fold hydrolase
MDTCFINYRGLAGCELTTPKWYCAGSVDDFIEPMDYVIRKYGGKSKVYAFGISLGSNNLTNLLGKEDLNLKIDAAVCFEGPLILTEVFDIVVNNLKGFYNRALGKNLCRVMKPHVGNKAIMD